MSEVNPKPFFKIYIVESPSPEDIATGRSESELLGKAMGLVGVQSKVKTVSSKEELQQALDPALAILRDDGDVKPFLHISSHGNEKGVILGSKELVPWKELRAMLAPINASLQGHLVLCMSTCYGGQAVQLAMTEGDLPVLLLVGIPEKVLWSQALIAFIVFYNVIAKGGTAEEAEKAMNAATRSTAFKWHDAQKVQDGYLNSVLRGLVD